MSDITIDRGFKWYATKEPIIVLLLSALAVVSFVAVAGLSGDLSRPPKRCRERLLCSGRSRSEGGPTGNPTLSPRSCGGEPQ